MVRANVSSFSGNDRSRRIGLLHLPHLGPSVTLPASIRFHVLQNWQRTVSLRPRAFVSASIQSSELRGFTMTGTQLQNSPQVGDAAPGFTAPSTSGSDVSLDSFRGKKNVLLAFFPLAFTGTCTKELVSFTEDFDQFATKGVEIL